LRVLPANGSALRLALPFRSPRVEGLPTGAPAGLADPPEHKTASRRLEPVCPGIIRFWRVVLRLVYTASTRQHLEPFHSDRDSHPIYSMEKNCWQRVLRQRRLQVRNVSQLRFRCGIEIIRMEGAASVRANQSLRLICEKSSKRIQGGPPELNQQVSRNSRSLARQTSATQV